MNSVSEREREREREEGEKREILECHLKIHGWIQ
jgi:hypothetical protein